MIEMLEQSRTQVAALCRRYSVKRLAVFGSAVTGTFSPTTSDLDFLVEFEADLSPGEYARAYFGLKADLEALFARDVDLVTRHSLQNPYLRKSVEISEQPLYAA